MYIYIYCIYKYSVYIYVLCDISLLPCLFSPCKRTTTMFFWSVLTRVLGVEFPCKVSLVSCCDYGWCLAKETSWGCHLILWIILRFFTLFWHVAPHPILIVCGVKGNGSKLACPKKTHKQTKQNKTHSWLYLQSEDPFWRPMVFSDGPKKTSAAMICKQHFSTVQWSMFKISNMNRMNVFNFKDFLNTWSWLVVEPTHLKNMLVKLDHETPNRDETKT